MGDSDNSKDSEQDNANYSWLANESQEIGDEDEISEPKPRCWEHGCNGYDIRSPISHLRIAGSRSM